MTFGLPSSLPVPLSFLALLWPRGASAPVGIRDHPRRLGDVNSNVVTSIAIKVLACEAVASSGGTVPMYICIKPRRKVKRRMHSSGIMVMVAKGDGICI